MVSALVEGAGNEGSAGLRRTYSQPGIDQAGPVTHNLQAHTPSLRRFPRQPDPVVPDAERDGLLIAFQADRDVLRPTVLEGVGDRFHGNAVDVRGRVVILHKDLLLALEGTRHAVQFA